MRKRDYLRSLIILGSAALLVACGSSKGSVKDDSTIDENVTVTDADDCQQMVVDAPVNTPRAFGIGKSPNRMFSYNMAIEHARVALAKQVETAVSAEMDFTAGGDESGSQNGTISNYEEEARGQINNMTQLAVKSASVVCSKTYKKKGQNVYETHVCVELSSRLKEEIGKRTVDFKKKYQK